MANFANLLAKRSSEVEKPKPLPVGTYDGVVKAHNLGESAQKKTPYVRFTVQAIAAGEDVDQQQLEEFGGVAKLTQKTMNADFYLTEDSLWRLEEFLTQHCKVEAGDRSIGERLPETTNVPVKFTVKHDPSADGKDVFAKIGGFAPAE